MLQLCSNFRPQFFFLPQNLYSNCLPITKVKFNVNENAEKVLPVIRSLKASATKGGDGKSRFVKPIVKEGGKKSVIEGLITESLPNGMFRVSLGNGDLILGYISGKIRKNFIRILPGDRVKVEVSVYDSSKGRIIRRLSSKE